MDLKNLAFDSSKVSSRMNLTLICALLCFSIVSAGALGQSRTSTAEEHIKEIETHLLPPVLVEGETPNTATLAEKMAEAHVPGVSVAVVHEGKIAWARGFGVTKIAGSAVTARTLFQAASISKPITALAVLHLTQAGKLNLDTDVNEYLKSWKLPSNQFTEKHSVTLRTLLTHTGGITVHGFPGYRTDEQLPKLVDVLDGHPPANTGPIRVDVTPGSISRYSGGGYVIAQQVLEDVTGEAFSKLMNETVLTPIGMQDSTFEQPLPKTKMKDVATPYRSSGTPVKGGPHVYPERAPAGLWTTPSDLARYIIEVQQTLAAKSHKVLTPAMAREMLTPTVNQQGLGPRIGGDTTRHYFQHGGANEGYRALLIGYEAGDGLVIMTNSDNGSMLFNDIVRTIAHEYNWPDFQPPVHKVAKVDLEYFDSLAGTYQIVPSFVVTFTRENGRIFVQGSGQGRTELFPEGDREFFAKSSDTAVAFEVDAGKGTAISLQQFGRKSHGVRLDDAHAKPIEEIFSKINQRVRTQTPMPNGERVIRRLFKQVAMGQPDYSQMGPEFAEFVRQVLPQLQKDVASLGSIDSISFLEVSPDGADKYKLTGEHGIAELMLVLSDDGKIQNLGMNFEN